MHVEHSPERDFMLRNTRTVAWEPSSLPHGYDHKRTYSQIGYNRKPTDMQSATRNWDAGLVRLIWDTKANSESTDSWAPNVASSRPLASSASWSPARCSPPNCAGQTA